MSEPQKLAKLIRILAAAGVAVYATHEIEPEWLRHLAALPVCLFLVWASE